MRQRAAIFVALFIALASFSNVLYAYEEVFNLGTVPLDVTLKRTITVGNINNIPLKIKNITSSCECLRILTQPSSIPPGSKDTIEFSLTPQKAGEVQYEITVEFTDARNAAFRYLVMATVREAENKVVVRTRNREYIISPESARSLQKENRKIVFVDVRASGQFEKLRMPGSMNVPLYAVKTKNFLKNGKVILMDEGYGYAALEKECESLRHAGWDTWILGGGLSGWLRRGHPVEGDQSQSGRLNIMPSAVLEIEKDYDNWLIIDASGPKEKNMNSIAANVVRLPFSKESRGFSTALEKTFEKRKSDPAFSVVIVTARGEGYELIDKRINSGKTGLPAGGIFYLAGGWEEYRRFQEQKKNILKPGTEKTMGKMTNGTGGSRINGKPCSTCP